ncbi:MAG TPA: hypothetical protein VFP84_35580 [Kofleriaceae bacterium]|nr:hypothetical protein [Kofleriaceae bacterium]
MTSSHLAFPLFALLITGCAAEPTGPAEPDDLATASADLAVSRVGGAGPGFLFGGAAGSVAAQRGDLTASGVAASLASRSSFDGTDGNVDSAGHIQDIVDRIACDARSGITANIALHAPGQGAAQSFHDWGSDRAWIAGLDALAAKLKAVKQADGSPQPVYIRYGKEFNQRWVPAHDGKPATCVDWLSAAADFHHRDCAAELFWQWRQVRAAFASAPNVKLVWCPTGQADVSAATAHPGAANPDELWPGADQVDVIGPDAYNGKRRENAAPAGAFGDFVALADAANKPFLISETGIVQGAPYIDASWYSDLFAYLASVEQHGVDVLGVAGFWRDTDFGDTTLRPAQGAQLEAILRAQPQRSQACVAQE